MKIVIKATSIPFVSHEHRAGFSVIELLVTIAVIGILLSMTLPILQNTRTASRNALSQSNLHSNGQELYVYSSDRNGEFPIVVPDGASQAGMNMTRLEYPDGTWSAFSYFNHTTLWPAVLRWVGHEPTEAWRAPLSTRSGNQPLVSDYLLSQAFMTDWLYWTPGAVQSQRAWRAVKHHHVEYPSLKSMLHESPASVLSRSPGMSGQLELAPLPVCFVDGHVDMKRLLDSTPPMPNSMRGGGAIRLVMTENGFRGRDF